MTFSAIVTGIVTLLKNLPYILEVFQKIGEMVAEGQHIIEVKVALKKMDKAIDKAKESKDTSELEAIFKPTTPKSK